METYRTLSIRATIILGLLTFLMTACTIDVDVAVDADNLKNDVGDSELITSTGPDHDADVQLADADIWIVPVLKGNDLDRIVWTLGHPEKPTTAVVHRTCSNSVEPLLWLSDPPNWEWSDALVSFHACGEPGEFYAAVELEYDGEQWIGRSSTGAVTILPPK